MFYYLIMIFSIFVFFLKQNIFFLTIISLYNTLLSCILYYDFLDTKRIFVWIKDKKILNKQDLLYYLEDNLPKYSFIYELLFMFFLFIYIING